MEASRTPSPALLEANRRLQQLRKQIGAVGPAGSPAKAEPRPDSLRQGIVEIAPLDLPNHLGWGSAAATRVLCAARERRLAEGPAASQKRPQRPQKPRQVQEVQPQRDGTSLDPLGTVKVYPDIACGMLREGQTAAGRVWLLLKHLDRQGQGWLRIDIVAHHLTHKTSKHRLCGKRQLRNLLRQGEGLFWTRDESRIWLWAPERVAPGLGVTRLTGRPVGVPVQALLAGIGEARAHLYATFHSGRAKKNAVGEGSMPIARATLTEITGVGRRSQRTYEERAGVQTQTNFAVGERDDVATAQQRGWNQGQALFRLKDYRGYQGKRGRAYLAWQLPNSYSCPHDQRPKGRQKRINRKLVALFMKGMTGNGEGKVERRYWPTGKLAARAIGRRPAGDVYWPGERTKGSGRCLWYAIGGR